MKTAQEQYAQTLTFRKDGAEEQLAKIAQLIEQATKEGEFSCKFVGGMMDSTRRLLKSKGYSLFYTYSNKQDNWEICWNLF